MRPLDHVLVLGGSVAGMLAARAVSDHAHRVTIIDRDRFPDGPAHRKGTPQSRHANNLMPRALSELERWFPGFADEAVARGAVRDLGARTRFWARGELLAFSALEDAPNVMMTRELLDDVLRGRLRALPNVRLLGETVFSGPELHGDRVTGARVRASGVESVLAADLVIDTTGRGSSGLANSGPHGSPNPPEICLEVGVRYASRTFVRRPGGPFPEALAFLVNPTPACPRGGVAFAVEGERWLVTLFGYVGEQPPTALDGFLDFAGGLVSDDIARLLRHAEPLDEGVPFHFPAARLRRFDRVERPPEGWLALGDAVCSLNPCYGQGITSAALQAVTLEHTVGAGTHRLASRHYAAAIPHALQLLELGWGRDAEIPGVEAPPSPQPAPVRWYLGRALACATTDTVVCRAFQRVVGGLAPPQSLLAPRLVWRVLRHGGRAAPRAATSVAA